MANLSQASSAASRPPPITFYVFSAVSLGCRGACSAAAASRPTTGKAVGSASGSTLSDISPLVNDSMQTYPKETLAT
jgi:hypothetical protein